MPFHYLIKIYIEAIIKLKGIKEKPPKTATPAQEKPESKAMADSATKGKEKAAKDKHITIRIIFAATPNFASLFLVGKFSSCNFSSSFEWASQRIIFALPQLIFVSELQT